MKNKKLVVISALLLSLGLTACGDDFPSFAKYEQGDDGSFHHEFVPYDNGKRIETISLSENDVKLNINETKEYQINATFAPSDAANPYLYYTSNNPEIVSVDENGKVTIANTGSASVSVFSDTGVTTDLNLEIYKPVEGISILPHIESETGYVCDITETRQFAVSYSPVDTTQKEVTWSIVDSNNLNPGDVTIDANGLLTVNAPQGTKDASFLVKAVSTANESVFATEKVTVNDNRVYAEGVAIYQGETDVSGAELEVTLGDTLSLSAKTTPEETTAGKIYWESSNPSVLTVDENGLVTPVKAPATADVTVSIDGHSAKVTINTIKVDVTSVTLDKHSLALTKGDIASLEATVAPDNASIKDVRYVVESGDAYVSVDQDGKVTAKASTQGGTANIRCVSVDNPEIYDDCEVTVTNAVVSIEVLSSASVLHNGGEETDLSVSYLPIDADPFTVTWSSSDDTIATIDQSGHVTTNSSGLTGFVTFTATVDGTSISHGKTIEVIDPLPDFAWGIAGTKSGWVLDERAPFVEATAEGTALYTYKTEYEFEVGDEWKVTNTNGEWVYNNLGEVGINISKSTIGAVAIAGENNNISMNIAGTYEITLNIFEGAQKDEQGNFYSGIEIIAIGKNLPGQPKYAYVLNGGEPIELTEGKDDQQNPQLEALNIEMSAGSTLLFENIAPDTPEVLTSLVIGGDDAHGFTIDEGVLTASKDGTFNFYVKLAYGNDVVYIAEKTVEPIYAYVLNNNEPVVLEEGTDPYGNPQLQVEGLAMSEGNTILFENIAPKTPEVLTSLKIGGDAHGFTIDKGILTSSKDGTFNFYVKLAYGNDVVYIDESAGPEPEFAWALATSASDWKLDESLKFTETEVPSGSDAKYAYTGEFTLDAELEFKVTNTNGEWVKNDTNVGFDSSKSTAGAFEVVNGNVVVKANDTYTFTLLIWEGAAKDGNDFISGVSFYGVKNEGPVVPSISFGIADPKVDVDGSLTIPVTLTACSEITYSCLTGDSYVEIDKSKSDDTKLVVNGVAEGTATIKALAGDGVTQNTIDIECTEVVPVETSRYYIETKEWFNSGDLSEKVYVYTYKDSSNPIKQNAPFPGEEATYVKDLEEGKKLFYFDIEDTYDTFVVSKVVNAEKTYQTNDVVISDLEGDNCVYLKEQPATVETKVEVGHYNYQLGISQNAGTISVGGSINLTITNSIGEVSYTVSPESSATVIITGNVATISSSTIGTSTITFSDESESSDVTFTLTVQEAPTTRRVYFETKYWFNSGAGNENVYAYTYKDGSNPIEQNAPFPGEATTWYEDLDNGKKIFYFDVSSEYDTIIFVKLLDGSPTYQTVDISLSAMGDNNCVYLASDTDENIARVGYYKLSV